MPAEILIGIIVWLAVVLTVLTLLRAASLADETADREAAQRLTGRSPPARGLAGRVEQRLERMDADPDAIVALMLDVATAHPAAARHAAAVAHFARSLARAAGLGEHEQGVVHTAGLLHDIGALALLEVGQHGGEPTANLLRRVPALAEVADVVEAQHEQGEDAPLLARILAIAEAYDTLGAAGSHLDHGGAIAQLRHLAGNPLDAGLVRVFIEHVIPDEITAPRPSVEAELRAAAGLRHSG